MCVPGRVCKEIVSDRPKLVEEAMDEPDGSEWRDFPSGVVSDGKGGTGHTSGFTDAVSNSICTRVDDTVFQHLRYSRAI